MSHGESRSGTCHPRCSTCTVLCKFSAEKVHDIVHRPCSYLAVTAVTSYLWQL